MTLTAHTYTGLSFACVITKVELNSQIWVFLALQLEVCTTNRSKLLCVKSEKWLVVYQHFCKE